MGSVQPFLEGSFRSDRTRRHRQHSVRSGHPGWQDSKPRRSPKPEEVSPTTISHVHVGIRPINLGTPGVARIRSAPRRGAFQGFFQDHNGLRNRGAKDEPACRKKSDLANGSRAIWFASHRATVPCFLTSHSECDVWNVKKYGAAPW